MAFEWVAGLFQSDNQQTRGLSGDQAHSVALDESNPYYNFRLRRHKAEGDLVTDPGLLWYTSPYVKRRSGLGTHVSAEVGDGNTANYTDILLILSREDFARASAEWVENATRALQQEFDNFCRRENYHRLHEHRPLGVRVLEDGSTGMGGVSLGLQRGEFVTGILPNLYTGPVRGSYPVIGVHVNLPGIWEGYQEVGRLYNDQCLFTLGNHWLDNFSHPQLQEAALYRLRQYPDGSFVHIINPDLQDQYQVTSTNQDGASVLTLATRDGHPLAYMVLAVIDPPVSRPRSEAPRVETAPAATTEAARPGVARSEPSAFSGRAEAPAARPTPRAPEAPSIAPPMMLDDVAPASRGLGGKTIIPDMPQERVFTLQERGALLQKVHFANFMLGYDVYFGPRGELGTHVESPAATFQVRRRSVSIVAHVDGVVVGGRPVPPGVEVPIEGDVKIEVAGQRMEYYDLRGLQVEGWPYVGEIRRPASSTYMIWGEDYQIGRSRECRVVLPDEPRNENIHWKPAIGDGATIRARSGEIPKSRFYTDSIMVASEHASVDLRGASPKLVCTARHCYAYVRRNGAVYPVFPTTSPQLPKEIAIEPGDEIMIGNCLFYAGFTSPDQPGDTAAAPGPQVDADLLASAVLRPDLHRLDAGGALPLPAAPPHVEAPPAPPGPEAPPPIATDGPPPLAAAPPAPEEEPTLRAMASMSESLSRLLEEGDEPSIVPPGVGETLPPTSGPSTGSAPAPTADAGPPPPPAPAPVEPAPPVSAFDLSVPPVPRVPEDEVATEGYEDPSAGPFRVPADLYSLSDAAPPPPEAVAAPPPLPAAAEPLAPTESDSAAFAPDIAFGKVVATDDAEAQFELGRPMHLVLVGWSVNGEVTCGNHDGCDLVIPENRMSPDQSFPVRTYFRLRQRGRRGTLEVLSPTELRVDDHPPAAVYDDPGSHVFDVIRRDDAGEEDFVVRLRVVEDRRLPDPRARLVAIDPQEPLTAPLVTRGLPRGAPRTLAFDGLRVTFRFDGSGIEVSDYLPTYRLGGGFRPFFVSRGDGRFTTAPEDGAPFVVAPGDRLVLGARVYELRAE
jgi:hypothetical protein